TSYREVVTLLDPLDFGHFLNEKREHFCGREWVFAEIDAWRSRDGERALLITGDPGAGKSALVAELVYRNPGGQVAAYHCCQADVPLHLAPGPFVRSIAAMLATQIPAYADAIERGRARDVLASADADPESAFELGVIEPLAAMPAPPGPARYVLVDSLDEALARTRDGTTTIVDLLSSRIERLPGWLRVVATTRRDDNVLDRFRGVRTQWVEAHDPRNREDVEAYIATRLASGDLAKVLNDQDAVAGEVGASLCALSDGSFLYAKQALAGIASGTLRCDEVSRQPPGLAKLFHDFFSRTFPADAAYAPTRELLSIVLAAHGGLTAGQLAAAAGVTPAALKALLTPLSAYLSDADGRVTLFHKSLGEWLTEPDVGSARFLVDRATGEAQLLAYCRRWADLDDDYPLRELPRHLAGAGDLDGLRSVLQDTVFAERRRHAGVRPSADVEDHRLLAAALLARGREEDVVSLSVTADAHRRDGVAAALRDAPPRLDATVRRVVRRLLDVVDGRDGDAAEVLNCRLMAVSVAAARGYRAELDAASQDPSPAVRAALVPHLYRYWRGCDDGEDRWRLLEDLGRHFTSRLGVPRQEMVEVIGGLALAVAAGEFDDDATMQRLAGYCRDLVARTSRSPLAKAAGRRLVLRVAVAALAKVMGDQPDYQPLNLRELKQSIPATPAARDAGLTIVETLEHPELGSAPIVDALVGCGLPFDAALMLVAERALVFHGSIDPEGVISAVEDLYGRGPSWFGPSCLYVASKVLETVAVARTDPSWLERYAAMTSDFVRATRATLVTEVATYEISPPLAGIELVFERHRPSG
ncbi:MAG TPA: ATP-binding protein, partial [Acidimicrobiales bacterium]|nr:ATP-binding protein [Acidimicrobiales bacterium]